MPWVAIWFNNAAGCIIVQELQSQMEDDERTDEEQQGAATRSGSFAGGERTSGHSSPRIRSGGGPSSSIGRGGYGEFGLGQDSVLQQRLLGSSSPP